MTRDGKIGVAVRGWPLAPRLLFIAAFFSFCGAGHAADWASGAASPAARGDPAKRWRRLLDRRAVLVAPGGHGGRFALGFRLAWAFFRRPPL